MTEDKQLNDEINDGFDLIEYPCDYGFKAMCKAIDDVDHRVVLSDIVVTHLDQQSLLKVTSNSSRTGKFESISLTVRLTHRDQLEAIYHAIAALPTVVMTL